MSENEIEKTVEGETDELDELSDLDQFDIDDAAMDSEIKISEDLSGFASGFPDWDIHPPKK